MVAVARRRQVERYIEVNVPSSVSNPEYKKWEASNGGGIAPKAKIPAAIAAYLKKLDEGNKKTGYRMSSCFEVVQRKADEIELANWQKSNKSPDRFISFAVKRNALIHRAISAQTEEQLQAIMHDAEVLVAQQVEPNDFRHY